MRKLFEQLPRCDLYFQNFHVSVTNWLGLHWMGYEQCSKVTYRYGDISDVKELWSKMKENVRGDIKKAQLKLSIDKHVSLDEFLVVNSKSFKRQGIKVPYSNEYVERIDNEAHKRGRRLIIGARDELGRLHAAAYIVWNKKQANYLMGGGDPELRNSGAHSLVLWEAIQAMSGVTRVFDFSGSMIEPVEKFVRSFGGEQTWYNVVSKRNTTAWVVDVLKQAGNRLKL